MQRIVAAQRRARMGVRQHLARPAASCVTVARDLVGLHSSDAASVLLAARARTAGLMAADLERALYVERSLARVLGMRGTLFVLPAEMVPLVHGACTRALAAGERRRTVQLLESAGIAENADNWLRRVEAATLAAVEARGEATAGELAADIPELRERIPVGEGKRWAGQIGVSTRVLFGLATDGLIIRARPRGSWISTQYRWALLRPWLGVDVDGLSCEAARTELARRWLASFGPGTLKDLRWWTGWTVAHTRQALASLAAVEVSLDGGTGFVLPGDEDPVAAPEPWAALLPALDPTVMGYTERNWYLGPHRLALFDRNGNAGPTVWWNGQVVGGWAQRRDGEIAVRLLQDVGSDAAMAVEKQAVRLSGWLGDVRFTPRFRTPLERELVA